MVKNLPSALSFSYSLYKPVVLVIKRILSVPFALVAGVCLMLLVHSPNRLSAANELPSPTPNIETIPAGSWIIAMDNTNQGISGVMNLRAYGLAVELLWAGIPLRWVIKAGKGKDEADMSLLTSRIFPSAEAEPTMPGQNYDNITSWSSSGGGGTSTTANTFNGTRSRWMGNNGNAAAHQITLGNVDISSFKNVTLSVAFASRNVDVGENLLMEVSYDGGTTWSTSVTLVAPITTNEILNINTTSSSTVSSNPYIFNVPPIASQISVRFRVVNASGNSIIIQSTEYYYIDDVELSGTYVHQFFAGPIIILPSDTAAARTVINAYNAPLAAASKIKVYQTDESISADVRYTLDHKPYIAVYNDGGNANIHEAALNAAGIGSNRYQRLISGAVIDTLSCFTMASEPHWSVSSYAVNDSIRIRNLNYFLESGGNFIAQCIAVDAFEKFPQYRFQSTDGLLTRGDAATAATVQYMNADMPHMQFHGLFIDDGGSLNSFLPVLGSTWKPPAYLGVYFLKNVIGDAALDTLAHVSMTKLLPNDRYGGHLTYLSGHDYSGTSVDQINGRRIYLNSVLMPVLRTLPLGNAYSNAPMLCERDTLKLFVNPPAGNSFTYLWTGPNGFTSTDQNPVVPDFDAAKAGLYRVTLSTTGGCRFTYPAFTVVMADQIGDVNATSAIAGCINAEGAMCVLEAPVPQTGTGTWSIVSGPGEVANSSSTLTSVTGLSGIGVPTYVKWLVTTPQGCRDSSITVISPPVVDTTYVSKYDNEYCLICPVNNAGTYYYIDPNGRILSAITDLDDGVSIGETEFCAALTYPLPGNPGINDVPTIPSSLGPHPYMTRYWSVHAEDEGLMTVRLFFTDEELASLMGSAAGTPYEFNSVYGLIVTIYPDNGNTFTPAGSSGGISLIPQFLRRGDFWEVYFQIEGSSTFYLHPMGRWGSPLPIELIAFNAVPENNKVLTTWSTASERNNAYFTVERSSNATQFEPVGEVSAAGNSNTVLHYSFVDTRPLNGLSYYRLKQTDFDGSFSYSPIVQVKFSRTDFRVYPNPSGGEFYIELYEMEGKEVTIRVFDILARQVLDKKVAVSNNQQELSIDLRGMPAGVYNIICSSGNISIKKSITIQ
jgi:hypothetical protein